MANLIWNILLLAPSILFNFICVYDVCDSHLLQFAIISQCTSILIMAFGMITQKVVILSDETKYVVYHSWFLIIAVMNSTLFLIGYTYISIMYFDNTVSSLVKYICVTMIYYSLLIIAVLVDRTKNID
jgi:hypothetical protein